MHGANASGRPFTGDYAGILLYATLHKYGFASQPVATGVDDGMCLVGARITNAVKCLPPDNKPLPVEIRNCNAYLAADLGRLEPGSAILALGTVAHGASLRALGVRPAAHRFAHGAEHEPVQGLRLFDSYHCSRYNTNTGRLTTSMFEAVFARITAYLSAPQPAGGAA
jgi:uracil-DNA glycosylase family 4